MTTFCRRGSRRHAVRRLGGLGGLLSLLVLAGCASLEAPSPTAQTVPPVGDRAAETGDAETGDAETGAAETGDGAAPPGAAGEEASAAPAPGEISPPWQIAGDAFPTQRLLRLRFDDGSGAGSFRLVLRLASPEVFQARAVDPFGRPLWSARVEPGAGLLIDHRQQLWCALTAGADGLELPLAPFPLSALPALLLGRLPAAGRLEPVAGADSFVVSGETTDLVTGQPMTRWSGRRDGDEVREWTLWRDGERRLSWVRQGEESILSDPAGGFQLRWRSGAVHELPLPLAPMIVPEAFLEAPCDALLAGLSPI